MFKSNIDEIIAKNKRKIAKIEEAIVRGFKEGLFEFEGHLIKTQLSGRKSKNFGLKRQSGIAANSLNVSISGKKRDIIGKITVSKQAWYLKVHQHFKFGGYIRAKNASYLTIPVNSLAIGRRARDMDLVLIKPAGRSPVLVRKTEGKITNNDIMFVLKKQVYIPKRLRFYEDFRRTGLTMLRKRILSRLESIGG